MAPAADCLSELKEENDDAMCYHGSIGEPKPEKKQVSAFI
jgi:hypothetical protein